MKPRNEKRAARKPARHEPAKRRDEKFRADHPARAGESKEDPTIAFALGGLAGSNAHGAGFLQAALDTGMHPGMISCTSGQILWVYRYLLARQNHPAKDALLAVLQDEIAETTPYHPAKDLGLVTLSLFGKPGMMRLAWAEAAVDLVYNGLRGLGRMALAPSEVFFTRELLNTLPARQFVMQRPRDVLESIAGMFNDCDDIGILFNSYDPVRGHEHIHLNRHARVLLHKLDEKHSKIRGGRTTYDDITPDAVRDGLWIYQYGFDDNRVIDGAYHRQIILDELVPADKIFVARPINYCWQGELPKTWPEVEDLKTEMFFDGSYRCECDKIAIVNKLIEEQGLSQGKLSKYHHVDIIPVEPDEQRSYFDYVFEDESVFTRARTKAAGEFRKFLAKRLSKAA